MSQSPVIRHILASRTVNVITISEQVALRMARIRRIFRCFKALPASTRHSRKISSETGPCEARITLGGGGGKIGQAASVHRWPSIAARY